MRARSWSTALLGEQLKILSEVDLEFDVETVGFETGEIDVMIEGLAPAIDADNDPADAAPQAKGSVAVTREGDLWSLGPHRVYCGNSLNEDSFSKLMGNLRAALVFTDPPYNVAINRVTGLGAIQHANFSMAAGELSVAQFTDFLAQGCSLLAKYSIGGSMHYLFMDWKHMPEILRCRQGGLLGAQSPLRVDEGQRRHGFLIPQPTRVGVRLQERKR